MGAIDVPDFTGPGTDVAAAVTEGLGLGQSFILVAHTSATSQFLIYAAFVSVLIFTGTGDCIADAKIELSQSVTKLAAHAWSVAKGGGLGVAGELAIAFPTGILTDPGEDIVLHSQVWAGTTPTGTAFGSVAYRQVAT